MILFGPVGDHVCGPHVASLRGVALGPGAGSGHRMVSRIQSLQRLTFRTRSLVELEESWVLSLDHLHYHLLVFLVIPAKIKQRAELNTPVMSVLQCVSKLGPGDTIYPSNLHNNVTISMLSEDVPFVRDTDI